MQALMQSDTQRHSRSGATTNTARAEQTVVVVGGHGGMSSRYREIVERHGASLRHYETRLPPGARHGRGRIALVIVMVGMVSHALREQIEQYAVDDTPVVYLKSASVSALKTVIEQWIG
jgi:hypothetical protein